ncbi:MAG: EAL domain-containing protein [Epulopiscium sp.]|nr:EAL domain-containing protein [Candidatus Epulonipiscium sp.]
MREQNFAEELEQIVFISDLQTNEILYMNRKGREVVGIENYRKKKCYEIFRGKTNICEFCNGQNLDKTKSSLWYSKNTYTNKHYVVWDKVILWGNRFVRMEIAFDITEQKKIDENNEQNFEDILMKYITEVTDCTDFFVSIPRILSKLGEYYGGEKIYVSNLSQDAYLQKCYGWDMQKKRALQDKEFCWETEVLEQWIELFQNNEKVIIEDIEELRYIDEKKYTSLKNKGVKTMLAIPMKIANKVIGMLAITNITNFPKQYALLEAISFFIVLEWNKGFFEQQLSLLSYYDALTGLPNKAFLEKKIKDFSKCNIMSIGVLYADIKNLNNINKTVGYEAGDFFLTSVSEVLKKVFGHHCVYRVEEDEFVVLSIDISYSEFMSKVKEISIIVKNADENSVSTGHIWTDEVTDIYGLIHDTKKRMYLEKKIYSKGDFSRKMYNLALDKMKKEIQEGRRTAKDNTKYSFWEDETYHKRILEYDFIVRQSYDEIYELNLSRNQVHRVYMENNDFRMGPKTQTIQEAIYAEAEQIHPQDKGKFYRAYAQEVLEECISGRRDHLYFEYRRKNKDGTYYWVANRGQRVTYPRFISQNHDIVFLVAIKNINLKIKEQEQVRQAERKNYLAMLKSCDYICDIDIQSNRYKLILNDTAGMRDIPLEGEYHTQMEWIRDKLLHKEDVAKWNAVMKLENLLEQFQFGKKEVSLDCRMKSESDEYIWRNVAVLFIDGNNVWPDSIMMIARNVQEQKDLEQNLNNQLLRQEREHQKEINYKNDLYKIVVEQTGIGVSEWYRPISACEKFDTHREKTVFVSEKIAEEFEFSDRYIGFFYYLLEDKRIHTEDREAFQRFLEDDNVSFREITCRVTKDRVCYLWYKFTIHVIDDEEGQRIVGTMLDVDKDRKATELFKMKAELDGLTGIANQETFYFRAKQKMDQYPNKKYAVIIMDIDKFKVINDLYSMNGGNRALVQIANAILNCIGEDAICARIYADVFYILTDYQEDSDIIQLVNDITKKISGLEYGPMLRPCFGISRGEECENSITLLCELAAFAHKYGKGKSLTTWTFYNAAIREDIIEEKQLESEMEFALRSGQFKVFLQPQYVIGTREVVGAEALVRWEHPEKGMVYPSKFIPLFEKNEFILKLDEYVWERVCMLLKRWERLGMKQIPIAVNMSRLHLRSPDLKEKLNYILEKYQIPKSGLELELTENLLFEDLDNAIRILAGLRDEGFTLNMDDFGSGYSSLNMLRNIPIDVLKIDRNFFDEKILTPRGKIIVKYVVSMAKELNMRIVAEGVETAAQESFLKEIGCDVAQGYYFSRPISIEEFEKKFCLKVPSQERGAEDDK